MQTISRTTNLSCGHRVMNERMKCFHLHGHEYITNMEFSFEETEAIGYAIDFKEIKRVFIEYLQEYMDHGMILNPKDEIVLDAVEKLGTKLWKMSLAGAEEYCNPTVENIAKEIFLAMELLAEILYPDPRIGLRAYKMQVYETPNCWTDCTVNSISTQERVNFRKYRQTQIKAFAESKGVLEYDDRNV